MQGLQCWFSGLLSRVEIVEGVSDFCATASGLGSMQKAGARAIKPGLEGQESQVGVKEDPRQPPGCISVFKTAHTAAEAPLDVLPHPLDNSLVLITVGKIVI